MQNLKAVCLLALLTSPLPLSAQDLGSWGVDAGMSGLLDNQIGITQSTMAEAVKRPRAPQNDIGANVADLSYTPSLQVRQRNLAQFVSKTRRVDPVGAAQMEKVFAQGDFIRQIDSQLRPMGMRASNVADAFAVYWVNAWEAANGVMSEPNAAQGKAVSRQAAAGLAATPAFASATDAQKQELAEAMLVQAALIGAANEQAQTNPAMKVQLQKAVRQGAKAMGLDLDAARLTEDGFVPTGKRSEADVAEPGVEPAKMAANDEAATTANAESNVHPAIWALGGAGALAAAYGVGKMMGRKG